MYADTTSRLTPDTPMEGAAEVLPVAVDMVITQVVVALQPAPAVWDMAGLQVVLLRAATRPHAAMVLAAAVVARGIGVEVARVLVLLKIMPGAAVEARAIRLARRISGLRPRLPTIGMVHALAMRAMLITMVLS